MPSTRLRNGGSGARRSHVLSGLLLGLVLVPASAPAQLEVLLRGLSPAPPRAGACGRYRFTANEPTGPRSLEFDACVERIQPGPQGSVVLRLVSGDSLEARVEVAPEIFAGQGGALLDHVRSIVEISNGDTTRLAREDWESLPGFDRAPVLPGARDSLLGTRALVVGKKKIDCTGRRIEESATQKRPLGGVEMTQTIERQVESWTAPEAPILGVVRATAQVRSERRLSRPVPGVPETGPRQWQYELLLLELRSPPAGRKR